MSKKIAKYREVPVEVIYQWDCPYCGRINESITIPYHTEECFFCQNDTLMKGEDDVSGDTDDQ